MKYLLITFLLILCSAHVYAQNDQDFDPDTVDVKTQSMFEKKKWNLLIDYAEGVLMNGVEFYQLRMRLGIAYYALKNYFKAIPNFEKALDIGYPDPEAVQYLYNSYLLTDRTEDKNFIFYHLPKGLRNKLKPLENSLVDNVHAVIDKGFSNDMEKNENLDPGVGINRYGEQTLNGDYFALSIGLNQIPLGFLNVSYDYTYRRELKEKQLQTSERKISDRYYQYHNQFYNRFDIRVANGLSISPAGHYLSIKDSTYYPDYETLTDSLNIRRSENFSENFILSLVASKYFSIFKFSLNGSFSYLNEKHQSQYGLFLKCYPFGKVNFYTLTGLVVHNQQSVSNLIAAQLFGIRIRKLLFETSVTFGRMNNYNEQNGYLVYDDPDIIKYKFGAELKYSFPYNLTTFISFYYQHRERSYIELHLPYGENSVEIKKANYNISSLSAGFKFDF